MCASTARDAELVTTNSLTIFPFPRMFSHVTVGKTQAEIIKLKKAEFHLAASVNVIGSTCASPTATSQSHQLYPSM